MISKNKVILICGYPASSKSTVAKQLVNEGFISLNRDTEGGTIADLLPKLEHHLYQDNDVVLDNLFAKKETRKPFIDLCLKHGAEIECLVMSTSMEDAQFNFTERMIKISGKLLSQEEIKKSKHPNIFPPAVFYKFRKEFEYPAVKEGFSNVSEVEFKRYDNPTFTNKALILDYDGTLRETVNGNGKFPLTKEQINILPRRKEILQKYKDQGYILLGVSNQSAVAKGELTLEQCKELFNHTNQLLGFDIDVSFCPHSSGVITCYCRKPGNAFFVDFMLKYKLDRKQCLMVGDLATDRTFSQRSGITYYDQSEFFNG